LLDIRFWSAFLTRTTKPFWRLPRRRMPFWSPASFETIQGARAATWDALPFDTEAARTYGRIFAATRAARRSSRGRLSDLLIASTAAANGLPLYTRNPADFVGLEEIVTVVAV